MENQISNDVREQLGKAFLKLLLPIISVSATLLFLNRLFIDPKIGPLFINSCLIISMLIGWTIARQKRYFFAAMVVSSAILIVALLGTWINGGVRSSAFTGALVPLTFFAWLTNPKVTYSALVFTLTIALLTLFHSYMGIPESSTIHTPVTIYINHTIYYVLIIGTAVIGSRMLHKALVDTEKQRVFLETTFSSMEDSVLIYTPMWQIVKKNRTAETFFKNFSLDEKRFFEQEIILEDGSETTLQEFLHSASGNFKNSKIRVHFDGKKLWFSLTRSVFTLAAQHYVLVIRDITTEIQQEYNLIQAQKMDAVGQLASGVAHDFNNMLAGIQGAADLLRGEAVENQKAMLDLIVNAIDKASKLTQELLVFSRKTPQVSTAIDVHPLIDETAFLLKRTIDKRITILTELNATHSLVVGDDTLIQSAMMNMGINASHAMPDGGTLTFKTSEKSLDELYCSHSQFEITPGHYLLIEIVDTGCGMSSEVQKRIFEPFFTTKEVGKGTGLGMAAVYSMVVKHNGAISIYSEIGKGTSFHIHLPLAEESAEIVRIANESIVMGSGTVLVVDDEELIQITTSELLRNMGYTVYSVSNGQEALDFLRENSVDVILLDMIMPVMNGREAFEKILESGIKSKVILSSGFSKDEDVYSMKEKGLFGFLSKPYQRSDLSQMIAKAVQGQEE